MELLIYRLKNFLLSGFDNMLEDGINDFKYVCSLVIIG